jgi:hypothetical protein
MVTKKWKSFANVDRDEIGQWIGDVLTEAGSVYETSRGSPAIVYDSSETIIFHIKTPVEIRIRLIKAVADPITRFFMGLVGGTQRRPATLMEIYALSKENEGQVKELISRLLKRFPGDPWDLKDHPMFARSPLLRLRVKKRWMRWVG